MKIGMKKTAAILAGVLTVTALAGCGQKKVEKAADLNFGDTYPLKTDVTFTYWVGTGFTPTESYKSFADYPFYKELEKETGVKVEFIHPVAGSSGDQFNVMIASGEYPDIIQNNFFTYPGGAAKAIEDGVIIETTDYLDKYAPNLKAYLENHPNIDKMVKTDAGQYYSFPTIQGDDFLLTYTGLILRKDWLDELGLDVPETIDEWETVLTAFKEKKGVAAPITYEDSLFKNSSSFIGAYGIAANFYIDNNGEVQYPYMQPEYKEYLEKIHSWYEKGLIDPNIASATTQSVDQNMINDKSGAVIGNTLGGVGKYLTARQNDGTKFDVVAAPAPVLTKGQKPEIGHRIIEVTGNGDCQISTQCANKELAVKWLDYGYSEAGQLLFNYGVEGESYTKDADGNIQYTDLLLNNPDGKGFQEMLQYYASPGSWGPFLKSGNYMKVAAQRPQQQESLRVWMDTNMKEHVMPKLQFGEDVASKLSTLETEISTYADEMRFKFIMGVEPIENFDKYLAQLKSLGVDEYVQEYRKAYDHFKER